MEKESRINKNVGLKGLKIKRLFTKNKSHRYEGIEFEKRSSKIFNSDGSIVFEMNEVEVPKSWSQIATDILAQKYLRKKGVPQKDENGNILKDEFGNVVLGSEKSAKEAVDRLAKTWRCWGEKYGYFDSKEDADAFEDEVSYMLINQIASPNSPQWFNTGLALNYNIKGKPQGHWYVDPTTRELKQSEDAYTRTQAHACFIISIKDDLVNEGGIFDTIKTEARIFKYGSGSGINFSPLRAKGEPLSGGGTSSGLMSFLKIFDAAAGSIKSGGTTRRAAKMVCLDLDHPEIEDFIKWKVIEERKVVSLVTGSRVSYEILKKIVESAYKNGLNYKDNKELIELIEKAKSNHIPLNYVKRVLILVENGLTPEEFTFEKYDTDFRSEAYSTVDGQNSNNSVRITNQFFEKLSNNGDWELINRTDKSVNKVIKAKDLWDKIIKSAWESADPGVQYDTTINEWHTCINSGRINASNPCSEYMFLDDTACNLASLNLLSFYDVENNYFDVEKYKHAIRLWTIVLEITVLMSHLPTRTVAEKTFQFRTLGLGYGNLGALLMQMGIPYESEEGYAMTGVLTAILGGEAYATSAEMAKILGPFEKYNENKEQMLKVIRNHRRAIYNADDYEDLTIKPMKLKYHLVPEYLLTEAKQAWDDALYLGIEYGYRNAQTTLIAPTGTIGLLMDFDTTGIEPDFAIVKYKKLVGGGYIKIINKSIKPALKRLGYTEEQIQQIEKYVIGHMTLKDAPKINHETLKQKGFTKEQLDEIENKIKFSHDLRNLFSKYNLSEGFVKTLNIDLSKLNESYTNILELLGFSNEDIEKAEEYVFGTMTLEGAPFLKEEDLKIFDCANKCGKKGKRYISPMGHLKQMAAAQPFLSGSISKTVNLPEEATLKDIEDIYLKGWKLMLKSVALYRDGSKLSQPLSLKLEENDKYSALFINKEKEIEVQYVQAALSKEIKKPIRRKLPPERRSLTHKFSVMGHEGYITVGLFEDGTPGEIFIKMSTAGSFLAGIMDAFAISLSLNLQYGVPLETLIRNLTNLRFEPNGRTSNPEVPIAKSIIDYIARWLALKFLPPELAKIYHNEELVEKSYAPEGSNYKLGIRKNNHINQVNEVNQLNQYIENGYSNSNHELEISEGIDSHFNRVRKARSLGFTGEICPNCGSMNIKKSGSCSVCMECGNTTGCS